MGLIIRLHILNLDCSSIVGDGIIHIYLSFFYHGFDFLFRENVGGLMFTIRGFISNLWILAGTC